MRISLETMLSFSLAMICLIDAIPQLRSQITTKEIVNIAVDKPTFHDSDAIISGQNQIPSEILTECLCVPYYRCDPGHWEKTEVNHCTRFMYVCCYGPEAIEYAMDPE